jgi:hypothetical protein
MKKLMGRPDPTPWILRPAARASSDAYVDCVIALDPHQDNTVVTRMLHEALSPYGVSLLIANEANVAALSAEMRTGKVQPHVYLDLCPAPNAELSDAAAEAGVFAINGSAKGGASARKMLDEAGLPLCMSALDPGKRRIRAYNVFGSRSLLWWTPATGKHEALTWDDVRRDNLMAAAEVMDRVTRVTQMGFFSAEIFVGDDSSVALIAVGNDQVDLNPASAKAGGPPDEWVKWCCGRLAEFVWRKKNGVEAQAGHLMWLAGR